MLFSILYLLSYMCEQFLFIEGHAVYIDLNSEPTLCQVLPTTLFNRAICEKTPSKCCK